MKSFLTLLFLFFFNNLFAQYSFGIFGGINGATVRSENINGKEPAWSYYFGISNEYKLSQDLGFELDLLYSRKGYKQISPRLEGELEQIVNHYLDLQFFTKNRIWKKTNVLGGFGCGYLFGQNTIPSDPIRDVIIEHFDVYFIGGLEYSLKKRVKLHIKYNHTVTEKHKNRLLQLGLNWKFEKK